MITSTQAAAIAQIVENIKRKWGMGWHQISKDQKEAVIAAECFWSMVSAGQINQAPVDPQIGRDMYYAICHLMNVVG